jgi:aryl-alcohol dehydrogenase-like predicted oxidoreductase
MRTVRLGGALEVSALGLGCVGMSEFYGPADEAEARRVLDRAVELGVTLFDTADAYGLGHNEELLSRWLPGVRDRVVIVTKFGILRDETGARGFRGDPAYVRQACEASLRRLGIDAVDLYIQHRSDPSTPVEDTVGALADLVAEGKVLHIGLSEAAPETIRRAYAVHRITAVESEWSLWSRTIEDEVVGTCRELGIGIIPYSPLGRGLFAGAVTVDRADEFADSDYRRGLPRFQGDNLRHNLDVVDRLGALAAKKGVTMAQLALAWLLAQGPDVVPIPGTTRLRHLEENVGAVDVALTPADLAEIEAVVPRDAFAGARYADMSWVAGVTPPRAED